MAAVEAPSRLDRARASIERLGRGADGAARLVAWLREDAGLYRGFDSNEAKRVRAHVLARFEAIGLPDAALPFVIEELETSRSPWLIAAAAMALRGAAAPPPECAALIERAGARLAGRDDRIFFTGALPCCDEATDAASELRRTAEWLASRAPACCGRSGARSGMAAIGDPMPHAAADLRRIRCQDQDGRTFALADRLSGRTSVIGFFYTRCMNPDRCSLMIARLAALHALAAADAGAPPIGVWAISYDPAFDLPERLHAFGADRGFVFGGTSGLLRCVSGRRAMRKMFGQRVNYGPVTVNLHASEMFVTSGELTLRPVTGGSRLAPGDLLALVRAAA